MKSKCQYCEQEYSNQGITRHLSSCDQREKNIQQAEGEFELSKIVHLKVRDQRRPIYQLHLEIEAEKPLGEIDRYLRGIWLECCNHLSMFTPKAWSGDEVSKKATVENAFRELEEMTHIYDYGSESRLTIKRIDSREGPLLTDNPVELMARNKPPSETCMNCDRQAEYLCKKCHIEIRETGLLCEKHRKQHPCENYGNPDKIVNSPRFGICGYVGPADPPY